MMKSSKWLLNNSAYQLYLRRNKWVTIRNKHAKSFWNASNVAFVVEAEGSLGVSFKIIVLCILVYKFQDKYLMEYPKFQYFVSIWIDRQTDRYEGTDTVWEKSMIFWDASL